MGTQHSVQPPPESSGKSSTLNAKVGGIALLVAAIALHVVHQVEHTLQPIRLLIVGFLIMGAWAFSDEMGLRKPLNRAAFISFVFSMVALAVTILEPDLVVVQKYYLIYAFTLLVSMLIWSAAFLHRQKDLKIVGALGAAGSLIPLFILILGHVSIGFGAFLGVKVLFVPDATVAILQTTPVRIIEALFILWAAVTALFLWRGRMSLPSN